MKKIIIAASIVGAAAAGVILYLRKRNSTPGQVEDAANDANNIMNKHAKKAERKVNQAMS